METPLDHKIILRAAEKIRKYGRKNGDSHVLEGISMETTPDEYTLILKSNAVTFTVFFHNKFEADAAKQSDVDTFYAQLQRIAATDYSGSSNAD